MYDLYMQQEKIEHYIDKDRILAFSDAVFAFAATLLVLKIELSPDMREQIATQLPNALLTLLPQYMANIITFLIIGYYWLNHHAIFGLIEKLNATIVWVNLLLLISVSFLPFAVDLYGDYPNTSSVVVFYSISVAIVGYILVFLWWYSSHKHRFISHDISTKKINFTLARTFVAPIVFTLSIPLVYLHPVITQISWIFIFIGILLVNKIYKNK